MIPRVQGNIKKENNNFIFSYSNIGWPYCNRCIIVANCILFLLLCLFKPCWITCSSKEMWLHWEYITSFFVWLSYSHKIHLPLCQSVTCPHRFCFSYMLFKCVRFWTQNDVLPLHNHTQNAIHMVNFPIITLEHFCP
jgi:hypothetical protein